MNIVITGGTSGLGEALKNLFERDKNNVIILARSANGHNQIKCDISNKEEVKNAFKTIRQKITSIDVLINNAGYGLSGITELLPEEEIQKIFGVNFFGALYTIQSALPLMTKNSKIINISSACALFALPFRTMYCASKSAISMLSDCLRLELAPRHIQVTAICPGNIKTNFCKNRVKIDNTNENYADVLTRANAKLKDEENNRMSVESASKKIFKIINKKKLKSQYIIGKKYKLLFFASKIFPKSLILWGTKKFAEKK